MPAPDESLFDSLFGQRPAKPPAGHRFDIPKLEDALSQVPIAEPGAPELDFELTPAEILEELQDRAYWSVWHAPEPSLLPPSLAAGASLLGRAVEVLGTESLFARQPPLEMKILGPMIRSFTRSVAEGSSGSDEAAVERAKAAGMEAARGGMSARDLSDAEMIGMCVAADWGLEAWQQVTPPEVFAGMTGVMPDRPLKERIEAATRFLQKEQPDPALASVVLATLVNTAEHRLEMLEGSGRFKGLVKAFNQLAHDKGLTSWFAALGAGVRFWSGEQGIMMLLMLVLSRAVEEEERKRLRKAERASELASQHATAAPKRRELEKAERRRERAEADAADAKRRMEAVSQELRVVRTELGVVRQSRDRAVERARALEKEVAALEAYRPAPAPAPAAEQPPAPPPLPPPPPEVSEADRLIEFYLGKQVYLFTGQTKASNRRDMEKAFRKYGAECTVIEARNPNDLGPEHYPPDALVVIDTRFMGHSISEKLSERARASGAWSIMMPAGAGSVARRVAEGALRRDGRSGTGLDG